MKKRISLILCLSMLFFFVPQYPVRAAVSVFEHSDGYMQSSYYSRLNEVELTGDYRRDIVEVARSQIGYHEGSNSADISGSSQGNKNYTEYGRNFGLEGDSWCAVFVWWCARQAGVQESIIHKTEWAKSHLQPFSSLPFDRAAVQPGDIAFVDTSANGREGHVGIVAEVSDTEIKVIEGNTSNAVMMHTYSRATGKRLTGSGNVRILRIGSPDYGGPNVSYATYNTITVYAPGVQAYSSVGGRKTEVLDNRERMLLSRDLSDEWVQIVASDGLGSCYIKSSGAVFNVRNLPPITGYNAWGEMYTAAAMTASTAPPTTAAPTTPAATTVLTAVTTTTTSAATTTTATAATTTTTTTTTCADLTTTAVSAEAETTSSASDTTPASSVSSVIYVMPDDTTAEEYPANEGRQAEITAVVLAVISGAVVIGCLVGITRRGRSR